MYAHDRTHAALLGLRRLLGLLLLAALCSTSRASQLDIGDAPPPLQPMAWVQGEPVDVTGPGRVRVLLFFASWCGASRQALDELAALAAASAEAFDVVAVNVREAERGDPRVEALQAFFAERDRLRTFSVAMDDPVNTPLFKTWMRAAGTYPTPTAFILGRDGRIAYMGFPIDPEAAYLFEDALRDALAGTSDLAGARRLQAAVREQVKSYLEDRERMRPIDEARESGDASRVLAAIESVLAQHPDYAARLVHARLEALLELDEGDALALARRMLESPGFPLDSPEDRAAWIGSVGRTIAEVEGLSPAAYAEAEAMLLNALAAGAEDYRGLLDQLALAALYRRQQRYAEAVPWQLRAVEQARALREVPDDMRESLEAQLASDRLQAARGGAGR
jgi:thiol-disulfide isomerase/thioredoxin